MGEKATDGTARYKATGKFSVDLEGFSQEALTRTLTEGGDTVTALHLWNAGLDDACVEALADGISGSSVVTLVVQSNASANVPPVTNWELLTRHNQLRHLTLSGCSLDDAAATAIGDTLSGNSSLFHLNLWQNRIGDKGAAALAAGLRRNRTLSSLDLGSNAIGDVGVVSLAAVLGDLRLTHAEVVERRRALASAAAPTEPEPSTLGKNLKAGSGRRASSPGGKAKGGREKSAKGGRGKSGKDRRASAVGSRDEGLVTHPFLRNARCSEDHQWTVMGNRKLCALNLDANAFGAPGVKALCDAVALHLAEDDPSTGGLVRLGYHGHKVDRSDPVAVQLCALLARRDPAAAIAE